MKSPIAMVGVLLTPQCALTQLDHCCTVSARCKPSHLLKLREQAVLEDIISQHESAHLLVLSPCGSFGDK